MSDDEELFTHTVRAWTAGDLRRALEGVPDDFPVTVVTAEEPGAEFAGPEQVIISAAPWNEQGAQGIPPDHFEIGCEFPSGEYYRRTR
jgi:hypothetical protein